MSNSTACQLLVSANTLDESKLLRDLQVPWIDLKDPQEGPLGRPSFHLASEFASMISIDSKSTSPWSFAGGELSDWDNSRDLPFIETLGHRGHIKFGLANCNKIPRWQEILAGLVEHMHMPQQAILVHYADASSVSAPSWDTVMHAALSLGLDKVLIDTAIKDGTTLLDLLPSTNLASIIDAAHDHSLQIALAGSIPLHALTELRKLGPDWIGIRGAVCSNPKDRKSPIDPDLVLRALALMDRDTPCDTIPADPTHSL